MLIIGAMVVAFLATISIATFYKTPSCTDNTQNQGEAGVDCGGPCAYLCTASVQPPTVLFTKALAGGDGRTDVIASVENKNAAAAAKDVPYRLTLVGAGEALIQEVTGTLDLPRGAPVPGYIPGIVSGKQPVIRAFLSIEPSAPRWFAFSAGARTVPLVSNTKQSGTSDAPRVEAVLVNPTAIPLNNVKTIVMVRDTNGDVVAASATVVPVIAAQGQAVATFTWNRAFSEAPAAIEVIPIIPLP